MPEVTQVLETSLYVESIERSQRFYQRLFGFPLFLRDARMAALGVPGRQTLLLFLRGAAAAPAPTPFGTIPPHDAGGVQHMAFAIRASDLDPWIAALAEASVPIESRLDWPSGSIALYFRDPDGHSIELATPNLWPNYTA